jgi:hypothetical protein
MSNNKKIGSDFEQEACSILANHGYWVKFLDPDRTGAQPFDIIAVKSGIAYCFDCKTCVSDTFNINRLEDNQIMAFEENGTKKLYFWLSDLAKAADNATIANWSSLGLIPTIRISPCECELAPSKRSMVAVLWDDFKTAAHNIAMSHYSNARVQALIDHFDPICKDYTATQPQKAEPQHNVDKFVKRMYELIDENKELKAKVSTLEAKLSEYEAIKGMFLEV